MIMEFGCDQTWGVFEGAYCEQWPKSTQQIAHRKMLMLEFMREWTDIKQPMTKLTGRQFRSYSMAIDPKHSLEFICMYNDAVLDLKIVSNG